MHSTLDYVSPAEFENNWNATKRHGCGKMKSKQRFPTLWDQWPATPAPQLNVLPHESGVFQGRRDPDAAQGPLHDRVLRLRQNIVKQNRRGCWRQRPLSLATQIGKLKALLDDKVCCRQLASAAAEMLGGVARNRNSKPIIHGILELLFASDVPLRRLHRSVAKQQLNLFQLASTDMAKPGTCATQVVGRQIGSHASSANNSAFQDHSEYSSVADSRVPEPGIDKLLTPRRHGNCS